jgi:hypothetical protein
MSNVAEPPKKPMNAYFMYQNKVKDEVAKKFPALPYKEMIQKVAEQYKNLSVKEKDLLEAEAKKLKDKYEIEREKYEAKYGKIERAKKQVSSSNLSKDQKGHIKEIKSQIEELHLPAKPKKPLSAFFLYRGKVVDQLTSKNPSMKLTEVTTLIAENYHKLSQAEKEKLEKEV